MGKVLIQMATDADDEAALAEKAVFKWPAPPAKAQEEETAEAEAPAVPSMEEEPAAKPVFFCKCAHPCVLTWLISHTLPAPCKQAFGVLIITDYALQAGPVVHHYGRGGRLWAGAGGVAEQPRRAEPGADVQAWHAHGRPAQGHPDAAEARRAGADTPPTPSTPHNRNQH